MLKKRLMTALVPGALLAGALAAAPSASARQVRLPETGFAHLASQGFSLGSQGSGSTSAATIAQSTNWSGYAVTGSTYTSVSTSWIEPSINCSVTPNSYAAFWDGLDGYSSSTVEQTGTMGECVGRTAEYIAWYETYPNPMYQFGGAVYPGDVLTAKVNVVPGSGNKSFNITLTDASVKGVSHNWTATTTQTVKSAAALSSAEFIAEAPSSGNRILTLADFGTATFSNPLVGTTALSAETGVSEMEMITQSRRTTTVIALPSALTSSGFSVTWK